MPKALVDMTVKELEQTSYEFTEQRRLLRVKQLAVQSMLSTRVEEQRISRLLGRDVQLVDANSIKSIETVGQ